MKTLYNLPKIILALVLFTSGTGKIFNPEPAIELLSTIYFIPKSLIHFSVALIPFIEIGLAIVLFTKIKTNIVNILCNLLFFGFFVLSVYFAVIGVDKDCGCFGAIIESRTGWTMVIRNFIFLLISTSLFFTNRPGLQSSYQEIMEN